MRDCTADIAALPRYEAAPGCAAGRLQRALTAFAEAACGKTAACRDGILEARTIADALLSGRASERDIALLGELAAYFDRADACPVCRACGAYIREALAQDAEDFTSHALLRRCALEAAPAARRPVWRESDGERLLEADVVILGGGMSGLAASIAAAEAGATVAVLEKSGTTGGAANMGMGFFAVESRYQRAQLIDHTVDGLFREFMDYTHWRVNAPLVKKLFRQSASTVDWIEGMGVQFLGAYKYFEHSNQTWHIVKTPGSDKPAERCAGVMVRQMTKYAKRRGVQFLFHTPASGLIMEDGRVVGATATDADGRTLKVRAACAVVATGGFGDDPKRIEERIGLRWAEDLFSFRIPGLTGDGLSMVERAGGKLEPSMIEVTYTTPGVTDVYKTLSETMRQPNLMVNLDGRRIIDESIMNNTTFTGNAISIQRGRRAFTVITDSILDEYRAQGGLDYVTVHHNIQNVDNWEKELAAYFSGAQSDTAGLQELQVAMSAERQFFVADSLEALCRQTGIDYPALEQTVAEYNAMAGRYDAGFNKHPKYMRALKSGGRYYAAAHYMCGYGTLAGVKTDEFLRVLDTQERPIAGLYGCGTDVCAIFGDSYNFNMPGSTMGFAINSGRLAGKEAAAFALKA